MVSVDDERVPGKTVRPIVTLAHKNGWITRLSYARGTAMTGKDCVPGAVVMSTMLACSRGVERVSAHWLAEPRATCPSCGKRMMPTALGMLAKHGDCAGGGARAVLDAVAVSDYAFKRGWWSGEATGWWNGVVPQALNVTGLRAVLGRSGR